MKLSDKIKSMEGSKTVAFTALIQQLRQEGREIIDLAVGILRPPSGWSVE